MTQAKRKRREAGEGEVHVDLGLGNLFKGLGEFLDVVSDLAEKQETLVTRQGEFKVKGLGDRAKGVYGFSVRTASGGIPKVERFGNIHRTDKGPEVAEVREPLVDSFDEDKEIVVVAELPGVGESEIRVEIKEDILSLETTGEHKYAKEILLPQPVDPSKMTKSYKNGILELRLKKA